MSQGQRVWLDGKVRATLDQSVPMIGAPEAWHRRLVQSPGGRSGELVSLRITAGPGGKPVGQTLINAYQNR